MTYALNIKRNLAIASLVAAVLVAVFACVAPSAQAYAVEGAYTPTVAQIPARVVVKGDTPAQAQDFTVQISGADGETVLPDQLQATIACEGSTQFAMSFAEVGLHHYAVRQVPGNAEGWTYDEQVYNVDVYCMWNGQDGPDSLYTQVFVKNAAGQKCEACTFENAYQAPVQPAQLAQPQAASMAQTGDMIGMAAVLIGLVALAAVVAAVIAYRRRSRE